MMVHDGLKFMNKKCHEKKNKHIFLGTIQLYQQQLFV